MVDELVKLANTLHYPVYQMIVDWSQSQNTSLYEQMAGGIRYIDLRVCWTMGDWYTQHFVIGMKIQVISFP